MKAVEKLVGPFEAILTKAILKRAVAIDACTAQLVERAVSIVGNRDKVRLIPNATNVRRFQPADPFVARKKLGIERFDPVVGYVGGRPWERGAEEIIQLLPKLKLRYPRIGALIVGGGTGLDLLRKTAADLGVAENVVFAGVVPYEEVPAHVACLDVGIALDQPYRLERWGNSYQKVRQYIACGVPVLTNSDPDGMIDDNDLGKIVDIRDTEDLLRAVEELLAFAPEEKQRRKVAAVKFAYDNLSVERAIVDRLSFWNESCGSSWLIKQPSADHQLARAQSL